MTLYLSLSTLRQVRTMDITSTINKKTNAELARKSEGYALDVSLYDNHMEPGSMLNVSIPQARPRPSGSSQIGLRKSPFVNRHTRFESTVKVFVDTSIFTLKKCEL